MFLIIVFIKNTIIKTQKFEILFIRKHSNK